MRPPLNAGEDAVDYPHRSAHFSASMRPPLNAGEDTEDGKTTSTREVRFNEAPAECGGRQAQDDAVVYHYDGMLQ